MSEKQAYELVGVRDDGRLTGIEILGKQAEPDAWALAQEYANLWKSVVDLFLAPDVIISPSDWTIEGRHLVGTVEPHTTSRNKTGSVRDAIVQYLQDKDDASISEILKAVTEKLGNVPPSSVRSSLNLNVGTPGMLFERTAKGKYRLGRKPQQ
jgi:hypothetical protein